MGAYMNEALFFHGLFENVIVLGWSGLRRFKGVLYKGFVRFGIGSGVESLMRFEDAYQGYSFGRRASLLEPFWVCELLVKRCLQSSRLRVFLGL